MGRAVEVDGISVEEVEWITTLRLQYARVSLDGIDGSYGGGGGQCRLRDGEEYGPKSRSYGPWWFDKSEASWTHAAFKSMMPPHMLKDVEARGSVVVFSTGSIKHISVELEPCDV
ncbi:hypothetical protein ACP70R_037245 [Stipagrostis hirtigluma subsp. patula]